MPISGPSNRFFKIVLTGLHGTVETSNIFYYRQSSLLQSAAADLAVLFRDNVLAAIRTVQTVTQTYGLIEVIDSLDVANFDSLPVATTGQIASAAPEPAFMVMSWRLMRSTRDMRSGWKRLSGIDESSVTGNVFAGAHFAAMQGVESNIGQALVDVIASLPLCIVRDRPTASDPGIDPDDSTTWRYTDVANVQAINRVTTQNTRKFFN